MPQTPLNLKRLWYSWKMIKLPWRRKWLVGFDLQGNTFWEFKDALHSNRNRRIVKYSRWTHYGDVNISPSWVQWLRHTRFDPPSLAEQQADVIRQERIKMLAAQADERWAAKPSFLDPPNKQQPTQMLESREPVGSVGQTNTKAQRSEEATAQHVQKEADSGNGAPKLPEKTAKKPKDSPWKQPPVKSNPGEDWQPQSWTPAPAKKR
ncbi:hypothetical protein GQ43DRAFT_443840 [Delitschia confertaspora ATCC 74209]|uniref:NADH dehydrogenase [ubiquinone] 1 alpha subcomplex subunit n=1 Tax=Delitschia confertaspora ATCC 74209 TaxID=1513339 RepID=A0A9P4JEQ8_9PLEO|nr:hypothetical protein GQ43DRAFT_443840 [Delitschia confertaspora ATCC 74209]